MTPEGNKAIVQRWVTEILDQGNLVGLERYVGSTSLDHAVLPGMAADRVRYPPAPAHVPPGLS